SWLNAYSEFMGDVKWLCANPPDHDYTLNNENGYDQEYGFLTGFTYGELCAIKEVTQKTIAPQIEISKNIYTSGSEEFEYDSNIETMMQNYETAYAEDFTDKMFLLSVAQLNSVYNNSDILGEDYYLGKATQKAIETTNHRDDSMTVDTLFSYWLRTPLTYTPAAVRYVYSAEGTVTSQDSYDGRIGIRPAFYLNTEEAFASGTGTEADPFTVADKPVPSPTPMPPAKEMDIKIGDYIEMGSYYDEPILWRCVNIDENGPLMLADEILCLKTYDSLPATDTTSGSHANHGQYYASTYWGDSNIRVWLNSESKAGNIEWTCGNPPTETAATSTSTMPSNAYDKEAGFLTNFNDNELKAITEVTQKTTLDWYDAEQGGLATSGTKELKYDSNIETVVQDYDEAYAQEFTDRMFLLDVKQVNAVYNNKDILGEDYYKAKMSKVAATYSIFSTNYADFYYTDYYWDYWLRTPGQYGYNMRGIAPDGKVFSYSVPLGTMGVRPAFYMSTMAGYLEGDGEKATPYSGITVINRPVIDDLSVTPVNNGYHFFIEFSKVAATCTVNTVLYKDGAMVGIKQVDIDANQDNVGFDFEAGNADKVKVFIWDNLESMFPISLSKEVTIE
ncbi:MAG: hypothetical protein IJX57_07605, partial [Clostridia bacterium]|nr:hypothetical protein [Clostridia bacterium]